jgi:1-deoxy-D-xylulose-5-phosphate reductoisomerase
MNKGMEVIEAKWLFDMAVENIDIVIHRESIVHSLVQFTDGSLKAQMSVPDMRFPIQYALSHPERWGGEEWPRLDLAQTSLLHFEKPDFSRFPCLRLAREAGTKGGSYPTVLSAADDVAVARFLSGQIGFMDIPRLVEAVISRHDMVPEPSLDEVLSIDAWARETAQSWRAD